MIRFTASLLFASLLTLAFTADVQADNVHFKSDPVVNIDGTDITIDVCLAGLGNKDIEVTAYVVAEVDVWLYNPSGNGKLVPGQNKMPVFAIDTQTIPSTQIKNGNVCFTLSPDAEVPITADPIAYGAPNANWLAIVDLDSFNVLEVTLVVKQVNSGKIVLDEQLD